MNPLLSILSSSFLNRFQLVSSIKSLFVRFGRVLIPTLVGVLFAAWAVFGDYSGIEATTINFRFKLRNWLVEWAHPPDDIVFVIVDDEALATNVDQDLKTPIRWPWPRTQWGFLHDAFRQHGIAPDAMVYDIVFDLADNTPAEKAPSYSVNQESLDLQLTADQAFQNSIRNATEIPTFLAALFSPQSLEPYTREDYRLRFSDNDEFRWVPLPPSFTRFGIPYDRDKHGLVFHAREVAPPWDSKWWTQVVGMSEEEYLDLEFMGMTSSLIEPASGAGTTTMDPEEDGVTRWAPLFYEYDGILYPSLPVQAILSRFGTKLEDVRFHDGGIAIPRGEGSPVLIPVDERQRMILNFRYDDEDSRDFTGKGFQIINYWQLVEGLRHLKDSGEVPEGTFDPRSLQDKIVVIGSTAMGTFDLRAVPVAQRFPAVYILGTIIRSIEQEDFLQMAPGWVNSLWIVGGTFLVGLLGLYFAPVTHALVTILLALAHVLVSFFLFAKLGVIVDLFHVTFAEILAYALTTITQYMQVSTLFGRYVSPEVRRFLMSNRSALELGGQEAELSILFSDLKGFTSMSEKLEAKEVISALNEYFGPMFKIIIDDYSGTLDKLIGDAIMAYFGHPRPNPDHPAQAVSAALSMQKEIEKLRERWELEGKPLIRMRIGVNTGTVVAGNMGHAGRTDYSIIGDNVNLASRLESNAPVDGVLISESTYERTKDYFIFKEREPILVKGKEKPVKVYEVLDFKAGAPPLKKK